jgi:hypothetical protein
LTEHCRKMLCTDSEWRPPLPKYVRGAYFYMKETLQQFTRQVRGGRRLSSRRQKSSSAAWAVEGLRPRCRWGCPACRPGCLASGCCGLSAACVVFTLGENSSKEHGTVWRNDHLPLVWVILSCACVPLERPYDWQDPMAVPPIHTLTFKRVNRDALIAGVAGIISIISYKN